MSDHLNGTEIAIIGMSGRFPGTQSLGDFWQKLCDGVELISFFTDEELAARGVDPAVFSAPGFVKAAAFLDDVESFDARFFNINPKEAEITDPQHRLFLECAWEALESAGYQSDTYEGAVGVYGGATINTYLLFNLASHPELLHVYEPLQINIGNAGDFLTTRVSYKLNLRGPSHLVQSACSTSLVAIHLACQSLLNGECDLALAGGVSVNVQQRAGYHYADGGMVSPDGHCRAFDAQAQGTIFGSGVGVVALKPLKDALQDGDHVYAVIKGSAINNDGALKVGYVAPSVAGQAQVISEALANANVPAATITYVETHGTGTPLGDPIEIEALTKAYRAGTSATGYCAIGSVKTNIGHLDAAAGVTGLIKTALALQHGRIPPSLHFREPNPNIDFAGSPFYVNTELSAWPAHGSPRRAGVSSFGVGGTNAHVILEEAPAVAPSGRSRSRQLVMLSAKTATALETMTAQLADYLRRHPDCALPDVAYTLQVGRRRFQHRRVVSCSDHADALAALTQIDPQRVRTRVDEQTAAPLVFMFPGQGAQYAHMTQDLYDQEPLFRAEVDRCAEILQAHLGLDLREVLYPADDRRPTTDDRRPTTDAMAGGGQWSVVGGQELGQTQYTQPALFVVEYALARLWMAWGLHPQALIGHSVGEYVAACLAGVFGLEDALALVAARGRMIAQLPAGAMLAVALAEHDLLALLDRQLSVAAINGPTQSIVAGPVDAVAALEALCNERGIICRRLRTSHAFHSQMLAPIVAGFVDLVKQFPRKPPQIPICSNVTGTWMTPADAQDPRYWGRHLRWTVRFADGLDTLLAGSESIFLEVGPGRALGRLVQQHPLWPAGRPALASLPHPQSRQSDLAHMLATLGELWLMGAPIDWPAFYGRERRRRVPLPTYPFEHERYWIAPRASAAAPMGNHANGHSASGDAVATLAASASSARLPRPQLKTFFVAPQTELERLVTTIWEETLGVAKIGIDDNFFELGGDSLIATQLIARLKKELAAEIPVASLYEGVTVRSLLRALELTTGGDRSDSVATEPIQEREERLSRRKTYQAKQRSKNRDDSLLPE